MPLGSTLAEFPAIEAYPNSDASLKVAAFVRKLINGSLESLTLPTYWRHYFWDRGQKLEACEGIEIDER